MEREYLTLEESGLLLVLLDRVRVQTAGIYLFIYYLFIYLFCLFIYF
jgi:hypothetical protein